MKLFITIIINNESDITNILNTWLNGISSLKNTISLQKNNFNIKSLALKAV